MAPLPARNEARAARGVLVVYTLAIFTSAFLLFLVQPMFSKMVLPLLGGSPAVWNTCMLFFQTVLLAGYLYAHVSARWLRRRSQALLHLAILSLALLTLPISIDERWTASGTAYPTLWLLTLLAASLGLPFFVLSSSGPLFQAWFAGTGHRDAQNPYFLYAASNLGSMIALLSYPLLVEPRLRLAEQSGLWTLGFMLLIALTIGCAAVAWRGRGVREDDPIPQDVAAGGSRAAVDGEGIATRRRIRWVLLAFAPSSLMLGVTTYITTDVAAVPLLWVIPLSLYLLTFIVAFARRQAIPHPVALRVQPFFVIPVVILMFWGGRVGLTADFLLHLGAFFFTALICHAELARDRPPVRHLTEFYLMISVGGALGGVFNTLIAPHLFVSIAEYPLVLALACLLRPQTDAADSVARRRLDLALPLALGLAASATLLGQLRDLPSGDHLAPMAISILLAVVCLNFSDRPIRFGLGLGALLLVGIGIRPAVDQLLFTERSFFGTHQVAVRDGGRIHALYHGTTLHGTQHQGPDRRLEITTYYHRGGPVGQIFAELHARSSAARVGVVGLGTGSMACYGRPGDRWTFFEIDPVVERIAREPRLFTFLRDCAPELEVVLGDARLTLAGVPAGEFDLLIIDAFSSDAIPIHLLTREAVLLYLSRLAPGGLLAFHVSNRHLELEPVLAAVQQSLGIAGLYTYQQAREAEAGEFVASASKWTVLAASAAGLGGLADDTRWWTPVARFDVPVWTDDFANLLGVFRWR